MIKAALHTETVKLSFQDFLIMPIIGKINLFHKKAHHEALLMDIYPGALIIYMLTTGNKLFSVYIYRNGGEALQKNNKQQLKI